jgi:hypothetical protein
MINTVSSRRYSSVVSMTVLVVTLLTVATKAALAANPDMGRIQTAAKQGVVAQEIELAADYFVGRGVPRD